MPPIHLSQNRLVERAQYHTPLTSLWSPSSSTVAGYNVYRGGVSGGPYTRINASLGVLASYTDTSVQSGQTYYYVTTAVDSNGVESGHSNEASALVPTP